MESAHTNGSRIACRVDTLEGQTAVSTQCITVKEYERYITRSAVIQPAIMGAWCLPLLLVSVARLTTAFVPDDHVCTGGACQYADCDKVGCEYGGCPGGACMPNRAVKRLSRLYVYGE